MREIFQWDGCERPQWEGDNCNVPNLCASVNVRSGKERLFLVDRTCLGALKYVVVSLIRTWRGLWWADEVSNGGSGRRWHVVEMVETRNQAWPDHTGPCRLYGCLLLVLPCPFATLSFMFCASGMLNCIMCHSGLICALSPVLFGRLVTLEVDL